VGNILGALLFCVNRFGMAVRTLKYSWQADKDSKALTCEM